MNWWAFSAAGGGAGFWPLAALLLASKWLVAGAIVLAWIVELVAPVGVSRCQPK